MGLPRSAFAVALNHALDVCPGVPGTPACRRRQRLTVLHNNVRATATLRQRQIVPWFCRLCCPGVPLASGVAPLAHSARLRVFVAQPKCLVCVLSGRPAVRADLFVLLFVPHLCARLCRGPLAIQTQARVRASSAVLGHGVGRAHAHRVPPCSVPGYSTRSGLLASSRVALRCAHSSNSLRSVHTGRLGVGARPACAMLRVSGNLFRSGDQRLRKVVLRTPW